MATKHEIKVGDNYNGFTIVCVTTATATVVRDGTQEWHIVPLKRVPGWTKTHSKEGTEMATEGCRVVSHRVPWGNGGWACQGYELWLVTPNGTRVRLNNEVYPTAKAAKEACERLHGQKAKLVIGDQW